MAENLKIIPLGGLNEIGKNMTVYEYGGEIIVVDCGMAFPGDDMYGIDLVIPDVSYLTKHKNRIRGLFITHGHEDHIGAIPYVLKQVNMPIYCTRLTAGLIRLKLEEHGLLKSTKIVTVESGMTVKAGKFSVEFIHVNHSIADSVAFAIHTGLGTVVHTGDFKIDSTPIDGEVIDLARFGELGKQGVLALLADSTNVERPGYTMKIQVIYSHTYSMPYGWYFCECARKVRNGGELASCVAELKQKLDCVEICLAAYSLKQMKKSGRISAAAAVMGELMGIRPIITLIDGKTKVESKVRGDDKVIPAMIDLCKKRTEGVEDFDYMIGHTSIPQAAELEKACRKAFGKAPLTTFNLGGVVSANTGPDTLALVYVGKPRG